MEERGGIGGEKEDTKPPNANFNVINKTKANQSTFFQFVSAVIINVHK